MKECELRNSPGVKLVQILWFGQTFDGFELLAVLFEVCSGTKEKK